MSTDTASSPAVDPVQQRESLLRQASDLAHSAVLAIAQGHDAQARSVIDELRQVRRQISTGGAGELKRESLESPPLLSLQRMRLSLAALDDTDRVIRAWIGRKLSAQKVAHEPLEVGAWQWRIDRALPERWSFEHDLFLVDGQPPPELLEALRLRGQRRVLVLGAMLDGDSLCRDPDTCVSDDVPGLLAQVEQLARPHPKLCAGIQVGGGGASRSADDHAVLASAVQQSIARLWGG